MDDILCPHCGKKVEITHALQAQLEKQIVEREETKFEEKLKTATSAAQNEAAKKIEKQFEDQMRLSKEEAEDSKKRNEKLLDQVTELTKTLRQLETKDKERDLEMHKKLLEEQEKIRIDTFKKVEEEMHLKNLEKDKKLQDTLKELEDTRRKLQQGSQQLQGEVFELELEEFFKREFPNDKIEEVAKGVRGGDIIQEVWDRNGNYCGKILWELKNTKTWSEPWIDKLKVDQRGVKAEYAVIVTEVLPAGVESSKYYKNIWITKRSFAIGLACALRLNLIQVYMANTANKDRQGKAAILYSYLSGTEFRLRIEAIVDSFSNMQLEIEKEKRYFTNKWARDEKNIRQVIDNTYGMHGDLKGIIGQALPQIKGIEFLDEPHEKDSSSNI